MIFYNTFATPHFLMYFYTILYSCKTMSRPYNFTSYWPFYIQPDDGYI